MRLSSHGVELALLDGSCLIRSSFLSSHRIHVKLNHPNIIKMWAAFKQADGVVIVQEYADGGDLLKIMTENGMRLSESTASRMVIKPLLSALTYLHSKSIIHRDIKLENIIFDGPDMTLKLADFGLCVSLREERSVTRAGTLDYMVRLSCCLISPTLQPSHP